MNSVEQSAENLNELAEALAEDGDATIAWAYLRRMISSGEPMPDWAQLHFLRVADVFDDFDPDNDDPIALLHVLQIAHSPKVNSRQRKSLVNYEEIYLTISRWREEEKRSPASLNEYFDRYIEEHSGSDEPLDGDTVKSAYYTVRRERLNAMEQSRPYFKRPSGPRLR